VGERWHKLIKGRGFRRQVREANKALAEAFRLPELDIERKLTFAQSLRTPDESEDPDLAAMIAWHGARAEVYSKAQNKHLRTISSIIQKTIEAMIEERHARYKKRRGMRVHRPQEWAARVLLQLMGRPEPIPWPDALKLIKDLTRNARP
jgi:hypothetical protein